MENEICTGALIGLQSVCLALCLSGVSDSE